MQHEYETLRVQQAQYRKNIAGLMRLVGARVDTCKGPRCGQKVYWITTKGGKSMPISVDGLPHWAACVDADKFKKGKRT
jgi:hypothetical protein